MVSNRLDQLDILDKKIKHKPLQGAFWVYITISRITDSYYCSLGSIFITFTYMTEM